MLIRLGTNNYDAGRFAKMRRKGDRLDIFLDGPREIVTVHGEDDIALAVAEVNAAMADRNAELLGGGWKTPDGWDADDE